MSDIDAAEEWLDSWTAQVNAQAERSVELSRRVAALAASAEGRDGAIRVTVGSNGQVEQLDLDERVHDLSGPRLAQEILAVMRRAQVALSSRVADEVRATVGEDTETGRGDALVRHQVPDASGRGRPVSTGVGFPAAAVSEAADVDGADRLDLLLPR